MKYKLALIGAGLMAEEHILAFQDIAQIEIVGITSRSVEKAIQLSRKYCIPNVTSNIRALYRELKPDCVVIAVNELSIKEVCMEAFNYGWKILLEKPLGYDYEDAVFICNAAVHSRAEVYLGLNRRHYSSTISALKLLENDGGPRIVSLFDQEQPSLDKPKLVFQNWMYANSIHLVDYFNIFCRGDLLDVEQVIPWNGASSSYMLTKLMYSSGDIGVYQALWNRPGPWRAEISSTNKFISLKPLERVFFQDFSSRIAFESDVSDWDIKFKPGLRMQAEGVYKLISGQAHCLPSIFEGLQSMKLVKDIYGI